MVLPIALISILKGIVPGIQNADTIAFAAVSFTDTPWRAKSWINCSIVPAKASPVISRRVSRMIFLATLPRASSLKNLPIADLLSAPNNPGCVRAPSLANASATTLRAKNPLFFVKRLRRYLSANI